MALETAKMQRSQNLFNEILRSEVPAGGENLSAWVGQVQARGSIDSLFRLETWLKGVRSYFNLEHLQLSESERNGLVGRSFAPEIGVVRQALQICESCACDVSQPAPIDTFDDFVEARLRSDLNAGRAAEQLIPADSIAQLIESLNDLRITIGALRPRSGREFQLYLTLGRHFGRAVRNCRYVDALIAQRFRLEYDAIENPSVAAILRRVPHASVRSNVALVFLHLFRFLKYLRLIMADLQKDRPLKPHLVVFSLLHEEMGMLLDLLKTRLMRNREGGEALRNAAELISYSIKTESERVQTRELAAVARETDPRAVFSRIENSHGLLRNCCQSSVLALIQSMDKNFDTAALFPSRAGRLKDSEKLRQNLWELRLWFMEQLASGEPVAATEIIARLDAFKEASLGSLMYRDWAEFEALSDALTVSGDPMEVRAGIRKFLSYLEVLIQEVSKRRVFHEEH